ncbi:MAG: glycosyltransferase family 4 protein [Pseudomonadota bacterium]
MKQKLLFITRKWPPAVGGMETYCAQLVEALRERADVDALVLPGREDGAPPSPLSMVLFGLRACLQVFKRADDYDVIHGGDMAIWPILKLGAWRAPKAAIVLSAHGTDVAFANRKGVRARIYRAYLRLGARCLTRSIVLANSRATAALATGHGFGNVEVTPLAAPVPDCRPPLAPIGRYVLFVGRLIERKGCRWFAQNVLPLLPEDVTLKIAGAATEAAESAVIDFPRVEFLGPQYGHDLARLRRNALVVIVPNISNSFETFEGFGLTTIEAASAGAVVIASNVDGVGEAVIDGITGFHAPPGDAKAWAAKIAEIQNWRPEERHAFIERAQRVIGDHFNWRRVARDTKAAYARAGAA